MNRLFLAGIAVLSLFSAAHATDLPQAMMGNWGQMNEQGDMERAPKDSGDFVMEKDSYYAVDSQCDIKEIEKLGTAYTVRAHCFVEPDPEQQWDAVVQFELRGEILHMENVGG